MQKRKKHFNHMKGIWITWEFQRRNIGISKAINYPLYQIESDSIRFIRYFRSIVASLKAIRNERPDIVIAQNPSIVLALFIILFRKIGHYRPVIDAHNSGIYPCEGNSLILSKLAVWLQRSASLTIVTNANLKKIVDRNGGNAFILPDALPSVPVETKRLKLKGERNLACICTFSEDEPFQEIIKAADLLPNDVHIYFTGKFEGKINQNTLPGNVHLTGYIPEQEYWNLLFSSDVVIDLTLREDCLVCGAYEGIALGKPLVLSNTTALKEYFSKGCVYSNPNAYDINSAAIKALENIDILKAEIADLKKEIALDWQEKVSSLMTVLNTFNFRNH